MNPTRLMNRPPEVRALFDQAGSRPSYTRFAGRGRMELDLHGVSATRKGEAIYEMIFNGTQYQFRAE